MNPFFKTSLICALTTSALLAGCGGGGGSSGNDSASTSSASGNGTLAVAMTDAPACGYDHVYVTVTKVRVHQSTSASDTDTDAGWTDIAVPATRIDLLNLTNGLQTALGAPTALPAGHYTQLRLLLDPNTGSTPANAVVKTGSTAEISLVTPSAVQSGIKVIGGFDVAAGQQTSLVLDFDACNSIVSRGNSGALSLKPVVKLLPVASAGIDGYVVRGLSNVAVSAQQNGQILSSTVADADGKFVLPHLAAGNYDVVITADNKAAAVIGAVPVAASEVTLNTATTPIALTDSTVSGSISGNVTAGGSATGASDANAFVAATQTLSSGTKITLRYRSVNLDGSYSLTSLPAAAPQYAQYSAAGVPAFAAQTGVTPGAGKYIVQATASGYATASQGPIDINAGNQVNVNLALQPQ
jgi:hypothetical protein